MARPLSHKIVASKMDILVEQRKYLQTFVDETDKVLQKTTSWLSNEDTTKSFTSTEINKMIEEKLAFLVSSDFSVGCEAAATEQEPGAARSSPSAPKSTDQPLPAGHVHQFALMARPLGHKIVASKMNILVEQRKYLQTFVDLTDKVLQKTTSWLSNEDTTKSFTFTEINKMIEDKLAFLVSSDFSVGCEAAATEQEPGAARSSPSAPKSTDQPLPAGHVHVSGVTGVSDELKTILSQVTEMQDAMSSLSTSSKMLSEKQLAMEKLVESLPDKHSKVEQEKLREIERELEGIKEKHKKAAIQQDIRITSFEKKIKAVTDSQSDIENCHQQQIKIKDQKKETEELKTQSQQLTKDLSDVLDNVQELNTEIIDLKKKTATNTQMGALEGEIESLKEILVELSRRNKEILTSAQKNESEKLQKLEEKLLALENSWSETTVENGRLYQDLETKLNNVCDQMADLLSNGSQAGVSDELKTILSQVNVMQDAMSSLSTSSKMLSEKQLAMEKLVESLPDKYSKVEQEKLREIEGELEGIKEKHEKAAIQQDIRMTSFDKKIQALTDLQSHVMENCHQQHIKIKDYKKETEELKTQSQQFTKDLKDVLENVQVINAEISVLEKKAGTNTQMGALKGEIESLREVLVEHGSLLEELTQRKKDTVKVLKSAQESKSKKLQKLEEKLSALENSWSETTVENGKLYQDLETKLDNLCYRMEMAGILPSVLQAGHHMGALNNNSMEWVKPRPPTTFALVKRARKRQPMHARSAFILFLVACRKEVAKAGKPPPNFAEFRKYALGRWNRLTADKKKLFESAAAEEKKRYEKEMAIRRGLDLQLKRPQAAFFCFLADFRIRMANQGFEYKELQKMAGEKWRSLTSEDKKPYEKKALEKSKINEPSTSVEHRRIAEPSKVASEKGKALTVDKEKLFESAAAEDDKKFEQEMTIYKDESVDPNKPKRHPIAFFVFLTDFYRRMANKGIEYKELRRMAVVEWRSLTIEDKKPYENKALEESKKHEKSLVEYRRTAGGFSGGPEAKKPRVEEEDDKEEDEENEDDEEDDEEDDGEGMKRMGKKK